MQFEEMQKNGYIFTRTGNVTEIYRGENLTAAIFDIRQAVDNTNCGGVPVGSVWWHNCLAVDSSAK